MDANTKHEILALAKAAHDLTESSYQSDPATRGDAGWPEKQRVLLADMALHLLQTALKEGELSQEGLKRNLYAILTIADQYLPEHELKKTAESLL